MKKVIVFRSDLLPLSETFIKSQVQALREYKAVLMGYRTCADGLSLDGLDTRLVFGRSMNSWQRRWLRLCQLLNIAHSSTVRCLKKEQADLVHAHFGTDATELWPSVRKAGLPMLVTLHGYDINIYREWWESGKGGLRRRRYPKRLLALAQQPSVHFIAVSKAIKKRAIEYGIPESKITVNYIGVDVDKFKPGPVPIEKRPKRILFVGRLVENKGAAYLIQAFAEAKKQGLKAELTIAGDGPLKEQLEELARKLDVTANFLGALNHTEVREQMSESCLFCMPSILIANGASEGFGLAQIEAQASGIPTISSNAGGTHEAILDKKTGFIIDPKDINNLSNHIKILINNDILLSSFSAAAIEHARNTFGICVTARITESIYNAIST